MDTYVLVHGAWHDSSAWAPVVATIEKLGHKAYAATLAGHGKGVEKRVTHAQTVQSVIDYIVERDLKEIVLLGHSYGGTVIAKVVEKIPERVKRLVFWNAFVLEDGQCINDNCPPYYKAMLDDIAAESPDGSAMLPYRVWREAFINDADEALAKSAYAQLSAEPAGQLNEKLDMKKFYELVHGGKVACSYLNCTEDIALPKGEWTWMPRMSNRLGLHRLVQMPGSHEVIFSNPSGLAHKIIEAGRD